MDRLLHRGVGRRLPPQDFRDLSIFPTAADLRDTNPFLRSNIIEGGYESVEHYLDVHFRLLREDVFWPLRDGIRQYREQLRLGLPVDELRDIKVYSGVAIIGAAASRWGVTYKIRFDTSKQKNLQKLMESKRLIFGSQVVLSADNFESIYVATVQEKSSESIIQGELEVAFEQSSAAKIRDLDHTLTEFTMVETAAYFEAYRHVLEGLQDIEASRMPFQSYIVRCESTDARPPAYLQRTSVYNLSSIAPQQQAVMASHRLKRICVMQDHAWPTARELGLDQSQFEALKLALTREFAIIQGPPGTGKTFIGLKIVRVLLENSSIRDSSLEDMMDAMSISRYGRPLASTGNGGPTSSPIVVVCYTNHALDQFLEGILEYVPEGVIRVGNRSTSYKLQQCALSRQKDRHLKISGDLRYQFGSTRSAMLEIRNSSLTLSHRAVLSDRAILKFSILAPYMRSEHAQQLRLLTGAGSHAGYHLEDKLVDWLDLAAASAAAYFSSGDFEESFGDRKILGIERQQELQQRLLDDYDDDNFRITEVIQRQLHQVEDDEAAVNIFELSKGTPRAKRGPRQDTLNLLSDKARCHRLLHKLRSTRPMTPIEERCVRNATSLDMDQRWRLYMSWVCRYRKNLIDQTIQTCQGYEDLAKNLRSLKMKGDIATLKSAKVIGLTTTGAARYRHVLQEIKPRVVIVEEAAEVLEAHIVATLSSACQHLILIGDHKQLRPNPTVYELAKTYNLDVSLFERMVNNNLPYKTLSTQHRMRPEFSLIMKKHFYDNLEDHPSVRTFEDVLGFERNMFYLAHEEIEQLDLFQSYCNRHEARLVVAVCRYLLQQGYAAERITILTPYNGQLAVIRKQMKSVSEKVRVSSIDGYQGEENDFILLSIVRSNDEDRLGFTNVANRVCVALSRARKGFYVFGNFAMLARRSELWLGILKDVQKDGMLAANLTLVCQTHGARTQIRSADDFVKAPDGGCFVPCTGNLRCGHACSKKCHGVPHEQATWKCQSTVPCKVKFTECGHTCPLRCCDPCPSKCTKQVSRVYICGHTNILDCHQTGADSPCKFCRGG